MEHNVAITHFTRIGDMLKKVYQQAVTRNNEMGRYLGNHNYTQQYAEEQRTKTKRDLNLRLYLCVAVWETRLVVA